MHCEEGRTEKKKQKGDEADVFQGCQEVIECMHDNAYASQECALTTNNLRSRSLLLARLFRTRKILHSHKQLVIANLF